MFTIPHTVLTQYAAVLKKNEIAGALFADYMKWLRYYLDFCDKYPVTDAKCERVRLFCEKLRKKRQTEQQQQQAAHAVSLYFDMQRQEGFTISQVFSSPGGEGQGREDEIACMEEFTQYQANRQAPPPGELIETSEQPQQTPVCRGSSHYSAAGYEEKSDSPEWDTVLAVLAAEIKVRHYSRKTLKTYAQWSRRFQRFLRNKPPERLSNSDVKEYLTHLAVKCNVAASTQNQAFNSLLFLYRHALKREFGELRDVPRAMPSAGRESPSASPPTPSATHSPPISCRQATTSASSRSSWGTRA